MAVRDITRQTIDIPFVGGVSIVTVGIVGIVLVLALSKPKKASITKTITNVTKFRK